MKVKLNCHNSEYDKHALRLNNQTISINNDDYDYVITPISKSNEFVTISDGNEVKNIQFEDIVIIESIDRYNYVYTIFNNCMKINMTLTDIETTFKSNFIRISKYCIININWIMKIKPSINMKFTLLMKNGKTTTVNRNYYYKFKSLLEKGIIK